MYDKGVKITESALEKLKEVADLYDFSVARVATICIEGHLSGELSNFDKQIYQSIQKRSK